MAKNREVGIRLSVKDADVAKRALEAFGKDGQAALKRIEAAGRPASVSLQALNAATGAGKNALGGFVTGAVAAVVPLLSLSAAINGTRAALDKFGDLADQAKVAGLDVELFQGLTQQAKLAGIEISATAGALAIFAQNSGLAAEGRGRMVTALKALNPELLRNIQLATTQEERIRLAADAIDRANSAAEKAALSAALFGNKDLALAFEGGAAAIDSFMSKARDLGLIVDRDVIARAEELGDAFDIATEAIDNNFKQALINLAPGLANFASWVAIISTNVRDLVDATKALEDRSTGALNNRLRELGKADVDLENREIETRRRLREPSWLDSLNRGALEGELVKLADQRATNQAEQASIIGILNSRTPAPSLDTGGAGGEGGLPPSDEAKQALREAQALIQKLRTDTEVYADTVADLQAKYDAGLIGQDTYNRGLGEAVLKFAKAADESDEYALALERLNAARAAGIVSERDYTSAVEELTKRRLLAQNDWIAGVQLGLLQVQEGAKDVAKDVAGAITGWADELGTQIGEVFRTGKFGWEDLVKTILADTAKLATQQFITKPLSGLLGSIFGGILGGGGGGQWNIPTSYVPGGFYPGLAEGTDNWRGGMTWVGERGPELLNLPRGAQVIPNHKIGSTSVYLSPTYNIDGSGLSPGQLLAVMEEHDRQLLGKVSGQVKKDSKNGVFG